MAACRKRGEIEKKAADSVWRERVCEMLCHVQQRPVLAGVSESFSPQERGS